MARPIKEGLDYFPLDTHFDAKIQALESVFKNDGLVWIVKFWQAAYRTNDGEVSLNSYHGVIHAENCQVTLEEQNEIIKLCLEINLLIKTDTGKYTSNGIKNRLQHIINERERWRGKAKQGVISGVISGGNPQVTGEIKLNKTKLNKTKLLVEPTGSTPKDNSLKIIFTHWGDHFKAKFGMIYPMAFGKEGKLLKDVLAMYGLETTKDLINVFFDMAGHNEWLKDKVSVGIFRSQLPKIIVEMQTKWEEKDVKK